MEEEPDSQMIINIHSFKVKSTNTSGRNSLNSREAAACTKTQQKETNSFQTQVLKTGYLSLWSLHS
ncbi:unnamed protein product [Leuciscus chuanchicus]